MCPPVTSLQGTPPFQNFPGLPITLRNKFQENQSISAYRINKKQPSMPRPPHLLLLLPLLTLLHCQQPHSSCLRACAPPYSLFGMVSSQPRGSLIPSSSLLKCHLLTHLNSFLLLTTQHPPPAYLLTHLFAAYLPLLTCKLPEGRELRSACCTEPV